MEPDGIARVTSGVRATVLAPVAVREQRPLTRRAAVREELVVAGVENAKTDSRFTLEFMGGATSTLLLPLAPSTSASCLAAAPR